ncbi:hypothetical protein PHLGIDRAFT_65945 [Phlebiopsis gigantea 11061_1 CR5-6]|uniref:AB hydrolase-1 domain-containing protein n=1 Tax=Phlebiopsis gigantea (strain 11061_1 CR5-6) TaxID=745531 RepID=A0A0C3NXZ0_PHLG1|nr:hypothetical protein PHLGIDRAFT_65945 [Phlebiopsis gigantea 11061_1 CR5-6]
MKCFTEYVEENAAGKNTLVFTHGWPSIWTVWGPQVVEFSKDYHVIALNTRGYAGSSFPGDVKEDGTFFDVSNDIQCLLDHVNVSKAVCVGIDWGSQICIEAARDLPNTIIAATGTLPYQPSYTPAWLITPTLPSLGYQVYFNNYTTEAIAELNTDVRRSLRSTYRGHANPPPEGFLVAQTNYLGAYGNATGFIQIDPIVFMTSQQEDYMVEQFERQGFDRTLYLYQNDNRVMSEQYDQANSPAIISQPVLFVPPDSDPVVPDFNAVMEFLGAYNVLPDITVTQVNNSAHWVTLEQPDAYNEALRSWLDTKVFV